NPQEYQCQVIIPEAALQAEFSSLTVDTYDDFERTRYIMDHLSDRSGIYYDDVLKLHHQKSIPHFEISQDMIVKLPDGKVSSYGNLRRLLRERIERSEKIILPEGFYADNRLN
ncbi:hypothetical protein, partial [Methanoculleus sp. MH98A]|uniref:hypothetical protein n=1 Tax=Methanoculleus sp. MH98A TaxID=1495314 RepID=UPI001E5600D3